MTRQTLIVIAVVGALVLTLLVLAWRENERRYDAFRVSGCLGDSGQAALGVTQPCAGGKRLCRDARPLFDWRHACD
ncbi:MAG TPA: hypothetical protein VFL90_19190 [Methylomirabilota bacterium]|nr:hypothetical protein [Methylomirabilota bacterium]